MSQYASPYNGIGNNPVNLIDRWGMCAGSPENGGGGGGYSGMPSWCDGYGGSYGSSSFSNWATYDVASNTFGNYITLAQKMDYTRLNGGKVTFSNSMPTSTSYGPNIGNPKGFNGSTRKDGRALGQFPGFDNLFFERDDKTKDFYIPYTDIEVNPADVMELSLRVQASSGRGELHGAGGSWGDYQNISTSFSPYASFTNVIGYFAKLSVNAHRINAVRNVGRIARIDAQGAKVVGTIGNVGSAIGWMGDGLSIIINGVNLYKNPTPGNWGRLGVSVGIAATTLIPDVGPYVSFGLSTVDAYGGFNGFYNWLDE